MAKKFEELRAKMSSASRARSEEKAKKLLEEMALDELRAARELTQEHLAAVLGVNQSSISKIEKRSDMYLSTLRDFIRAMGGELEIRAIFPDGTVRIQQLGKLEYGESANRGIPERSTGRPRSGVVAGLRDFRNLHQPARARLPGAVHYAAVSRPKFG